jgi:orotidine-5'-phosphate decarboxylase
MVTDRGVPRQGVFRDCLADRAADTNAWLCVGLDPDLSRLPDPIARTAGGVTHFCREIIAATCHVAAAYKLNFAFFECLGADGWQALAHVRAAIPAHIPVIADAKRGDIGNTAAAYAAAILEVLDFGAVTVNPYLGGDSIEPFLDHAGKTIFVLCKTSNPGAADFQDRLIGDEPLYMKVAREALRWKGVADVGLVVGATQPEALRAIRALNEETLLLVPGVGAQGADAEVARVASNRGGLNALITVSRQILFASAGADFASAAQERAEALRNALAACNA